MSKLIENLRIAFSSLGTNKLRAALTIIGIGVGIAAVIILVSLGDAVKSYINQQFLTTGADLVTVRARGGFGFAGAGTGFSSSSLTDKDLALLQDPANLSNVKLVVPTLQLNRVIDYGTGQETAQVVATTPSYFDALSRTIDSGRLFNQTDVDTTARVAVIGQTTVTNVFPSGVDPVGQTMHIAGISFRVIGVLASSGGSSGAGGNQDNVVVIPLTTARVYLDTTSTVGGAKPLSQIYIEAANSTADTVNGVVTQVTALLHTAHKIKANARDDFNVQTSLTIVTSLDSVISTLTLFLAVIGGISLIVGGIGVMNIMLVTVTERTREIGLRKAVGARNWDVLAQFITESVVLCLIGGCAGLALAYGILAIAQLAISQLNPVINLSSIAVAVGVTCAIGVFFGLYPANRAASLTPLQALRFE